MPREKEDYRAIYGNLLEHFGGKRWLSRTEVAEYLGICSRTVEKRFGITKDGAAIETVARRLSA